MAEESSGHGIFHRLGKKTEILLSTKNAWLTLDDQQTPVSRDESSDSHVPQIEICRQETIQQWLDSGFLLTAHENLQQAIQQTDSLSKQGVVPVTVNDYMRSLQELSETPTLSRGTSFNSCPSAPSIPKSISEWLEFWQKDPVEILLDLGFGADEPDICTKIPARFLRGSSAAKGINIRVFLEAQKQRMDIETPSLYGRFRQLEVLDQVTNAFSSLLNNVNSLQREVEEKEQTEEDPKLAQMRMTQDRRRRIGQLLRKASKQTIRRECMQGKTEKLKGTEEPPASPMQSEQCSPIQSLRMNFADHSHLCSLREEPSPIASNEPMSSKASPSVPEKPQPPLLSMALKQPPLPCTTEGSSRDRTIQEKSLLLTDRLRQVVHLDGKPPDSFEMEEVQSSEEEPGNPLEGTLGTVGTGVTRVSSCQSDSSGFLEDPSEPFPLQISPLLPTQSLSCGKSEAQTPPVESLHHHPQEPTRDDGQDTQTLPKSDQEEKIFACVEDSLLADHLTQEEPLKETPTGEGLERKENSVWNFPPRPHTNSEMDKGAILSRYDSPGGFSTAHIIEYKRDCLETDESGAVLTGRSPSIMGSGCDKGTSIHIDENHSSSEVPRERKARQRDPDVNSLGSSLENGMLTTPRQSEVTLPLGDLEVPNTSVSSTDDDIARCRSLGTPELSDLSKASPRSSAKEENFTLDTDTSINGFRSVTIQMPSKLVSGIHSITPGESPRENPLESLLLPSNVSKNEASPPSGAGTRVRERQTKEVSVQTEKNELRSENFCPALSCCSVPRRWCHLTRSVSLDSGSQGAHRETSKSKVDAHSVHFKHPTCCCCCCCHRHHCHTGNSSCSYQHHLQAHLTKTVKILREAVVRESSPSTAQHMEMWKTVCQSFREHSEEIGHHLMKQQAYVFNDMPEEGREEMRQLHILRQDLHQQVAELEFQLSDRARQIQEGMILFDQLLEEQSQLCSELCLSDWGEGHKPAFHTDSDASKTEPLRAPSPTIEGQEMSTAEPCNPGVLTSPSSTGSPEVTLPDPATSSDSWDPQVGSEEKKSSSQTRMDLKGFLYKLKKTFKRSFGNEPAEGQH